eukprot:2819848-Rhodomonas_salina.1
MLGSQTGTHRYQTEEEQEDYELEEWLNEHTGTPGYTSTGIHIASRHRMEEEWRAVHPNTLCDSD